MNITPGELIFEEMAAVTLVAVEVFGTDHYGLADAVQSWSDCNRARGHLFRVDDIDRKDRRPQDVIQIYVPVSELDKLMDTNWEERADDAD